MLQIFGQVSPPPGVDKYGDIRYGSGSQDSYGLTKLISNLILTIAAIAGVWALINMVLAGLEFMSAQGDPKKTAAAWQKINMSGIGLLIIVSSFVIAALIGWIFFGEWNYILIPRIYGPGI